ncbi:MAG: NAD(P)/FAD-dependent oxidoreductase [Fimbriimonadaceae bacterium]
MESRDVQCDVAIIGGGPSGSTVASLLKKYNPGLEICVVEREVFPRDHIGESLLPPINAILEEMECWDKVEAAGFPIKIGATYRWGKTPELWDFEFFPAEKFEDKPRPSVLDEVRRMTSFQVDRAIYDEILLDHAASFGVRVEQGSGVKKIRRVGDKIAGLELADGRLVSARHYVDASGNVGALRKAMGVECEYHPALQNIAIWDYWQNAEWAVKIGVGGTRIQVRSLPYGWIWFIPLGPTRTSVGIVIPVDYYKSQKLRPADLYKEALKNEPEIARLLANATCEEKLESTKDWSFTAERSVGENWYLVGECAGFADPILSAGVTMAQLSAQQLAYTINEIELGGDAEWLKDEFSARQFQRVKTHIKFGDYWYTSNAQFQDLQEFTSTLADACGLTLSPAEAWRWIAQGGFINEDLWIGVGGFGIDAIKDSSKFLTDLPQKSPIEEFNLFRLNLRGAKLKDRAVYEEGRVRRSQSYVRNEKVLPLQGVFKLLIDVLETEQRLPLVFMNIERIASREPSNSDFHMHVLPNVVPAIEAMVSDGWIKTGYDPSIPLARPDSRITGLQWNTD